MAKTAVGNSKQMLLIAMHWPPRWLLLPIVKADHIHSTTYLDTEDFSGPLAKTFDDSLAFVMRIAEGAARNTSKEFAQFLYVALGHLTALRTALQSVHD